MRQVGPTALLYAISIATMAPNKEARGFKDVDVTALAITS